MRYPLVRFELKKIAPAITAIHSGNRAASPVHHVLAGYTVRIEKTRDSRGFHAYYKSCTPHVLTALGGFPCWVQIEHALQGVVRDSRHFTRNPW
jgi:hypothetical protein